MTVGWTQERFEVPVSSSIVTFLFGNPQLAPEQRTVV